MTPGVELRNTDPALTFASTTELAISAGLPAVTSSAHNATNATHAATSIFLPCSNPDNLIAEATAESVESLFHLVVLPVLEIFGVATNVLNCRVFWRQGLKDRVRLCLFSLALADIAFLLLMFAAKFFSFLGLVDKELEEFWSQRYLSTVLGPLFGAMTISNMLTMILALERCVCVLAPFQARTFLQTRYMLVLIVTMSFYILGVYSLLNLKYQTLRVTDPRSGGTRWVAGLSPLYLRHRLVIDVLYNHLLILAAPCLSLGVVVVATSLTVLSLRRNLAWRQQTASRAADSAGVMKEVAVTRMLVVICVMYMLTMTPSVTQRFFRTLVPGYLPSGKYCNTFVVIQTLVHVCEVANSSFNFLVYLAMGSRFKSTLRQLMGRGAGRKATPSSPIKTVSTVSKSCAPSQ